MIFMNQSNFKDDLNINIWRQHIIHGLLKAMKIAPEIKEALKSTDAKTSLIQRYEFSPQQAQSLIDLKRPIDEIDEKVILKELENLKQIEAKLKKSVS